MRAQMSDSDFAREMECDPNAAVPGTFYADQIRELEKRGQIAVNAAEYNPEQKVFVACDLGYSDSTAFWFWQPRQDGFAIIDYFEDQGRKLPFYFKMLDNKGYDYDTIWLPHDARAETLQTRRSTVEQVADKYDGTSVHVGIVPKLAVQHGIDAARLILESCWFNQSLCYAGIEALRAYRRRYDEVQKSFSKEPVHDWSSDGADGFRYLALACRPQTRADQPVARQLSLKIERPKYTLDKLWEDREPSDHKFAKLRM